LQKENLPGYRFRTAVSFLFEVKKVKSSSAGISVIELLFVLLLAGILAAAAVPHLPMGAIHKQSVKTLARQIAADLRWTRQLALTDAAQNPAGYELKMEGSEPYTGYSVRNCRTGAIVSACPISPGLLCRGGRSFSFGPLGNLIAGSDSRLRISANGVEFTLTVIPATGAVLCRKEE